jgi:predicted transcriptional regulator
LAETPRFGLRLPRDLREQLERIAQAEHRTLTNQIVHALREWVAQQESGAPDPPDEAG